MYKTDKGITLRVLRESLKRGQELEDFNIFEIDEAKVILDEWYRVLVYEIKENIIESKELIDQMNSILEEEPKQMFTSALRRTIQSYSDEYTKNYNLLKSKLIRILNILEEYINEIERKTL